jgi:uncharacterized protein (TIGR03435 family)
MLIHLADVSVRSLLLAGVAAGILWILRKRGTAALQHAVWTAVVCGMLALFVFGQALPRIPLRVLDRPADSASPPLPATIADLPAIFADRPEAAGQSPFSVSITTRHSINWAVAAECIYGAVALAFLAQLGMGMFFVRRLFSTANPVPCAGKNAVYESECISVPVTIGWFSPRILLPPEWREWDSEKLDAVLAHEGAHVRRRDVLVAALSHLNRCIFWFHPLAWMLERKLALLAEQACDECSVAAMGDHERYARLLLEMAIVVDSSQGRLQGHVLTMAAPSHIRRRIDSLLQEGRTFSRGLGWAGWAGVMLCGIPVVLCAGALELDRQQPALRLEIPKWAAPVPPFAEQTPTARPPEKPQPVLVAQARPTPPVSSAETLRQFEVPSDSKFTFEVVSIRQVQDDGRNMLTVQGGVGTKDSSQVRYGNISLTGLLFQAFNMAADYYEIDGLGDELSQPHFDVIAKIPAGTTKEQFRLMMQNMLEERFGLKVHGETKIFAAYNLVVAKGGPKLKEAADVTDTPGTPGHDPSKFEVDPDGFPKLDRPTMAARYTIGPNGVPIVRMTARAQPVSALLGQLRQATKRPVQDKTGLSGKYDFNLEYALGVATEGQASDPGVSDMLYAIKSLGLTVEPTKMTLDVLIVDHIEKTPTAN